MSVSPRTALPLAIACLGAALGAWALADILISWNLWKATDSWWPMLGALKLVSGPNGATLYETLFFGEQTKFQYPPSSLLPLSLLGLVIPLTLTTLNALNALVLLLNAAALAALAWLVFAPAPAQPGAGTVVDRRWLAGLAFAGACLFYPVTYAFKIGQIQVWIDLAFTLACILWFMERRAAAGVMIGLACAIKPQFGMFLLWAILWRRWDFASGFLASALPAAAASIMLYGWHNHMAYLDVLSFISRHGESYYANNSINGIVHRLLFNGPNLQFDSRSFAPYNPYVFAATMVAGVAFLVPLLLRARGARQPTIFDFGMAGLCFTMGAPVAWEHHYGIMLPLYVLAFRYALLDAAPASRHSAQLLLAGAWFLSAGRLPLVDLLSDSLLNILQAHLFFGGLLLIGVLYMAAAGTKDAVPLTTRSSVVGARG